MCIYCVLFKICQGNCFAIHESYNKIFLNSSKLKSKLKVLLTVFEETPGQTKPNPVQVNLRRSMAHHNLVQPAHLPGLILMKYSYTAFTYPCASIIVPHWWKLKHLYDGARAIEPRRTRTRTLSTPPLPKHTIEHVNMTKNIYVYEFSCF